MVRSRGKASSQAAAVIDAVGLARLEPPKSFIESLNAFSNGGRSSFSGLEVRAKGWLTLAKTFGRLLGKAADLSMSDDGAAGPPRPYRGIDRWRQERGVTR